MRIVFSIEVGIEVPTYVQAGEILDKITRTLDDSIGEKGHYDVSNFRTRHTPVRGIHGFEDQAPTQQAMTAEIPSTDRKY